MSRTLAALLGGAAGAVALVGIVIVLIWFCLSRNKNNSRTSETGSSDPSLQVGRNTGFELSSTGMGSRDAKCFMLEELALATKNFSEINLIGGGKFGEVYKGLLHNGMIVAIKRRIGAPSQEFVIEEKPAGLARLNFVTDTLSFLLYFLSKFLYKLCTISFIYSASECCGVLWVLPRKWQQMIIYEYVPNGSIHTLYGNSFSTCTRSQLKHTIEMATSPQIYAYRTGQLSKERLEFSKRFNSSRALKVILCKKQLLTVIPGLPQLIHKNFKTSNVLVDENFIARVADAGIRNLLGRVNVASPSSSMMVDDIFLAPEVKEFGRFSDRSDVYSFGVFLLELVSGREAMQSETPDIKQSLVDWVQHYEDQTNISVILDHRLGNSFTAEGMKEYIDLTRRCVDQSSQRRPTMNHLASELERIHEKEVNLTTVMGEGNPTVTLGSQLFRTSR
ncbi:hypothetical protein GIB67_038306 [Kingdonia uniflora]|uniref:non-specific serine/threonine protein kinase n=1 Tax=Kingdonia uniflora TaxID=39325 RepID=A0A7J7KUH9_9MAGN|nr:hypothetical protein GIB67_038306 [Kingdonia uniflora]